MAADWKEVKVIRDAEGRACGLEWTMRDAQGELPGIRIMASELTVALHMEAAMHGIRQKIDDAAAMPKGTSVGDRRIAMIEVANAIKAGTWNRKPGKGEGESQIVLAALARVTGQTIEEVRAGFNALTDAERKALAKDAGIVRVIGEIRAERAARAEPTTDTKAILARFKTQANLSDAASAAVVADAEATAAAKAKRTERGRKS